MEATEQQTSTFTGREVLIIFLATAVAFYIIGQLMGVEMAKTVAMDSDQRAMICFDEQGKTTIGDDFKECRLMAVSDLPGEQ